MDPQETPQPNPTNPSNTEVPVQPQLNTQPINQTTIPDPTIHAKTVLAKKNRNKGVLALIFVVILIVIVVVVALILSHNSKQTSKQQTSFENSFFTDLNNKDYSGIYNNLADSSFRNSITQSNLTKGFESTEFSSCLQAIRKVNPSLQPASTLKNSDGGYAVTYEVNGSSNDNSCKFTLNIKKEANSQWLLYVPTKS